MYRAKQFLDEKQEEHRMTFGVYADVNSKIAEWMQEYTNQRVIEELDRIPRLDTPLGEEIRMSYHYVLKRIKELKQTKRDF